MKNHAILPGLNSGQLLDTIKNNIPLGFSVVDREGIIVDFNKAAEKITGYTQEEVTGKSHYEILHGTSDTEACPLLNLAILQHKEGVETESAITKKNGDIAILSVTTFPLIDDAGTFMGGVELFRDLSDVRKLERERKNIFSMFVHDMKTPVLTTGGFISRMLSGKAGNLSPKQKEYLTIMEDNLHKVESLIMSFLDFSRIQTKGYKPEIEYFDLGSEIRKAIESVQILADKKNIIITYIPPAVEPVMIHADPMMLARVMENLIGNALKYTEANGTVRIELLNEENHVLVTVADTGIGIAEKNLPHIFDAFFRVSSETPGSGLGLAITKTIIESHGGRIWVKSSVNAGTSFHFTLPKKIN
ncbi:MAG: PAS domain-containing sensor histidine kinase [Desulfobulbaceae bacterium]